MFHNSCTTSTITGLQVRAHLVRRSSYKKGIAMTQDQMQQLDMTEDDELRNWDYTLRPV